MESTSNSELKEQVHAFWNQQSCDTQVAKSDKFSKAYFEEIETFRYFDQPFIHSFAQFTRYHGKKVLEVGFGAGTDILQWIRAGADVSGIDLTQEALDNITHRIQCYGLKKPSTLKVADAENLPFESNTFDLGYSFGVLHHSPDTKKAIEELVRVTRPGGEIKIMLYNRHSVWSVNQWIKHALLKARPWKSLAWVFAHHHESLGTKAYTRNELAEMLSALPLEQIHVRTEITGADYLSASRCWPLNFIFRMAIRFCGWSYPWHPDHYAERTGISEKKHDQSRPFKPYFPRTISYAGNRVGFFHCISALKRS